ncbi:hypothetical protein DTO166G4_8512 [Paecilomyces variotii]|nr:hypothetical protein DTO166G4_8512 [Paecilomyces variotii]KAJ9229104.1 hypothetical protein DTO166G5_8110 [Paecilomyces variotii]KAJ9289164.1 hypothetical protein DTO021C3_3356 [Paecilomyces variotii]KAJ9310025.1 hypothetical protein DTO217A2_311 [Paecilomyces variotii]KAJ9375224.1 hypothetical protein DTO282E5_208 [Paecilomyces variotii]
MYTCPNSVIRCRLTAGLSSCVPRSRNGLGQWRRYAAAQTARGGENTTSQSDASASGDPGYKEDNLKESAFVPRHLFKESCPRDSPITWHPVSKETSSFGAIDRQVDSLQEKVTGGNTDGAESSNGLALDEETLDWYDDTVSLPADHARTDTYNKQEDKVTKEYPVYSDAETRHFIERRTRRRVVAAVDRAGKQLKQQKRVIDQKWFRYDIAVRMATFYPFDSVHRLWPDSYTRLYKAKFYKSSWQQPSYYELDDRGKTLLQELETDNENLFQASWKQLARAVKAFQWPRLALHLLWNDPKLAMKFLLATTREDIRPPFGMVADCLLYLDEFHAEELKHWKSEEWYHSVIHTCLDPQKWPVVSLNQKGVRLYIKKSDHQRVLSVFRMMGERKTHMSAETALCFMMRFTEFGNVDKALEALQLIPITKQAGFELDSQAVLRHCCKLLTLDTVHDENGERNFKILPKLLGFGVKPDRDMMNVVVSNAFKTGDPQLGLDMVGYMKARGFELDSYTYLTLLTDAVARGDRGGVDSVIQEIGPNDELRKNPYIAGKIFHAHYTFSAKHLDSDADPSEVFTSMLNIYSELYSITPLKDLLILPPHYRYPPGEPKPQPTPMALYIIIATYLRCQSNSGIAYRLYQRFRQLLIRGHETIVPLAETDHTYNEFLVSLRKDPRALRCCVQIVEEMLHPLPGRDVLDWAAEHPIAHAKPTTRTWTILLSAFIYNRQPLAAEKIREMMAKHEVTLNGVTWNTIINGYANAQKVEETAEAIKMMEEQGFPVDAYTMKGLRYLRDPERLRTAIEELDQRDALRNQHSQLEGREEREQLLDEGLRRLAEKSNSNSNS